jgi:hypothetical protein
MSKLSYPLKMLRVASPCNVSWDDMTGDDGIRFCRDCQRHVYNLSVMSRTEAEELVLRAKDRLCVYFYRRQDGTVMTSDCPVGLQAVRRRVAWLFGMVVAFLFMAIGWGMATLTGSRNSDVGCRRLREIEPLRTVIEWIDPTPPQLPGPPQTTLGALCPPQRNFQGQAVDLFEDKPQTSGSDSSE